MPPVSRRKSRKDITRLNNVVDPYDKVLIVCEGSKTEPYYFKDLRFTEKLSSANVKITGDCGSDPMSVVNYAISLFEQNKQEESERHIDQVFCLIDRDDHPNFDAAVDKIHRYNINNRKAIIFPVRSYPSFEYWYICHFTYTRGGIKKAGKKSAGDRCVEILKPLWIDKIIPKKPYEKNDPKVYSKLTSRLDEALKNSINGLKDVNATGEKNPSTEAGLLVSHLLQIKSNVLPIRSTILEVNQWVEITLIFSDKETTINTDSGELIKEFRIKLEECQNYTNHLIEIINRKISYIYEVQINFLLVVLRDLAQKLTERYNQLEWLHQSLDTPPQST